MTTTTTGGTWWGEGGAPWMAGTGPGRRGGHRHGPGFGGFGHGSHGGHGGPPGWLRGAFGGHPPFGGFGRFGGSPGRRGRGDVRLAVLGLLADEPMHGYQLIREVARRSRGSWRISPGSVYPMLSALEDEGKVSSDEEGGRRSFQLTDAGRSEYAARAEEFAALWEADDEPWMQDWQDLKGQLEQVLAAAVQVSSEGTESQRERAAELLEDTRRALYRVLAEDDQEPES